MLKAEAKQHSEMMKHHINVQRLENNLTALLLSTTERCIYGFASGFYLLFCFDIAKAGIRTQILHLDCSFDFDTVYMLKQNDFKNEKTLFSFDVFVNDKLPKLASLLNPVGIRCVLFLKNQTVVMNELENISDHWKKLHVVYKNYLTCDGSLHYIRGRFAYVNMLLTGTVPAELEMFLGCGKEKELKKHSNIITTTCNAISECTRPLKTAIIAIMLNLNEIDGFLRNITGHDKAQKVIKSLIKVNTCIYIAVIHIQTLANNFMDTALHFIHLLLNVIHSFDAQELSDVVEEEVDTDKVLEFLAFDLQSNVIKHLMDHVVLGQISDFEFQLKSEQEGHDINFPTDLHDRRFSSKIPFLTAEEIRNMDESFKFSSFTVYFQDCLRLVDLSEINELFLTYDQEELTDVYLNLGSTLTGLSHDLLNTPVLAAIPFQQRSIPLFSCVSNELKMHPETVVTADKRTCLIVDPEEKSVSVSIRWQLSKLLLYLLRPEDDIVAVKQICLNFSHPIFSSVFFSLEHVSVLLYQPDSLETNLSMVCQIPLKCLNDVEVVQEFHYGNRLDDLKVVPPVLEIEAPLDIEKPAVSVGQYVDFVVPIKGFYPSEFKVSGPRRIGSVLNENRRSVLLVDLDMEASDDSCDDEDDDEEDETEHPDESAGQV